MKKTIIPFLLCLMALSGFSQTDSLNVIYFTPDHLMDTVFDKDGTKFLLRDLQINPTPGVPNRAPAITTSCSAGYFNLYYAANSGFDSIASPRQQARRNVLCKLFTDISNFINSPLSAPTNTNNYRVNILIDDPSSTIASSPAFLGGASSIYATANNPASPHPGIADCEVWKTIMSGKDSYINVFSPLSTSNGSSSFYHGRMLFNFLNYNWNLDVNNPTMLIQTYYDFYSTALHEATHLLGFASLINFGGVSQFGINNNYFSRYDTFLQTLGGTPLITTTNTTCYNYGQSFTLSPTVIAPGNCTTSAANTTSCGTAIKYLGSANVCVFTPNCFKSGSSLSHFEDMCTIPPTFSTVCTATPSGSNNDLYYCMSDANATGDCYIKRHLQPTEKNVLCDLGYSVNATYNPSSGATYAATVCAGANFNYTTTCSTNMPVGINDGLTSGSFLYSSLTPTLTFPLSAIIGNDVNTASVTCIEPVYNNGTITGMAAGTVTFVANTGVGGVILLRYLPQSSTGIKGNITYIYGFIKPANCNPPNACNIVQNGTFENVTPFLCGEIYSGLTNLSCWINPGANGQSPDLYTTSSGPCNGSNGSQLGVNTLSLIPPVNSHNPAVNKKLVGVLSVTNPLGPYLETMKNYLSSPLIPGTTYVLNCWLRSISNGSTGHINPHANKAVFAFASDQSVSSIYNGNTFPSPLNPIATFTLDQVNTWIPYTYTFTFASPGSQQHNSLYFGIDYPASVAAGFTGSSTIYPYVMIDDISILPINLSPTVTIPSTVACTSAAILNLNQYALPSGGVFSGPGVTVTGGQYDFNSSFTLTPGTYGITYSYTNTTTGCVQNISVPVTILSYTGSPATFTLPSPMCRLAGSIPNMSVTLSPTTIATSGVFTGPGVYIVPNIPPIYGLGVTNLVPLGLQTYTYSNISCGINLTATTNILPAFDFTVNIVNTNNCLAPGQTATLTATSNQTSAVTYTWLPGGMNTGTVTVTPSSTTVYTVTGSNGVCTATKLYTVYVTPPVTISFTNVPTAWCLNQSVFYLENYLSVGTPTGGTWTGYSGIYTASVGATAVYVSPITTPGTYTIMYSYNSPSTTCNYSNTFTVSIQGFSLITNQSAMYCSNIGLGAIISASATPNLGVNYTWQPGLLVGPTQTVTPSANTVYTVTASNGNCNFVNTVSVSLSNSCCTALNYFSSSVIGIANTTTTYNINYAINQNIVVQGTVFIGNNFAIAPNVKITVPAGNSLWSNRGGVHLYACTDMWDGIQVQNGGTINFTALDVIEDAKIAIESNGCTGIYTPSINPLPDILVQNATFNRNYIAIKIANYTQPTNNAPFLLTSNVFTSRNLGLGAFPLSFGTAIAPNIIAATGPTNSLSSPYLVGGYAPANLKAPFTNQPGYAGVYIENSGTTTSPTSTNPVFTTILIGDKSNIDNYFFNLFDNLMYGIYSLGSNVESQNNTFQNTRRAITYTPRPHFDGGYGIYAVDNYSTASNNYLTITHPSGAANNGRINKFYDCYVGIGTSNIFAADLEYADIRSSQTPANPAPNILLATGNIGIYMTGNRFKAFTVDHNALKNLNIGIYFVNSYGNLNLPGQPNYGQYLGKVTINRNEITSATSTVSPVSGRISTAIYAAGILANSTPSFKEPNADLRIQYNNLDRVYAGVQLYGFNYSAYSAFAANNTIQLIQDVNANQQFGVAVYNAKANVINTNTITGFGITNTLVTGVYSALNGATSNSVNGVQCNSVTNVFAGFEFAGSNVGSLWRNNSMSNIKRGLHLTNNGIIGQQGTASAPGDNKWIGNWAGNFNTFTDAYTFPTNSPLYVRTGSPYFPTFNGNTSSIFAQTYLLAPGSIFTANSSAPFVNCFPTGGGGGGCPTCKMALLDSIANNNITYTVTVPETKEINQNLVYNDVAGDPSLATASSTLSSFYATNLSGTRGLYQNIDASFAQGNLNGVATLLAAFNPTTNIENNYNTYYSIAKSYFGNGSLTLAEELNLLILAHQCPFTDGAIVYDARSLYNLVTQTVIKYNDYNCSKRGFSFRENSDSSNANQNDLYSQLLNNETITKNKFNAMAVNYELYPNPAQSEVNISSVTGSEIIFIRINDATGKLLMEKKLIISDYSAKLDLNLINGIYIVEIVNKNQKHEYKKLIISK